MSTIKQPAAALPGAHIPEPADLALPGRSAWVGTFWPRVALAGILAMAGLLSLVNLDRVGYGNLYYAAAVKSMLTSWHNLFFASFDPGGFVSVDKPPLGLWIQVASARLLGFQELSLLLPQALAGLLSVGLLYHLVRRVFGPAAGLTAAAALAITPIAVATNRNNTVDSLLILALLATAWAVSLAAERGRLRWLLLGFGLVGLGFNIKMLQAFLPLPAFGLVYLVGAPLRWRTRLVHYAAATLVLLAVSLPWAAAVDLTPPDRRPYVGSSTDNTVRELIIGHNGLARLVPLRALFGNRGPAPPAGPGAGPGPAPSPGPAGGTAGTTPFQFEVGERGPLRLFNRELAGQISWLLPLAVVGLLTAARQAKPRWPLGPQHQALLLWGVWLATGAVFFSVANLFHRYYLAMLGPPLAALAGLGLVGLWREYRRGGLGAWLLPLALAATAVLEVHILAAFPEWSAPLVPLVVGAVAVAIVALIAGWLVTRLGARRLPGLGAAATAGCLALFIAPAVWSALTVWPASGTAGARVGLPYAGPDLPTGPRPSPRGGGPAPGRLTDGPAATADPALIQYLQANRGQSRYLAATPNANLAAPLILATGEPVMALGGFSGGDPILTADGLANLVNRDEVRYFLLPPRLGPGPGPGPPAGSATLRWVNERCVPVRPDLWQTSLFGETGGADQEARPGPSLQLLDCGAARLYEAPVGR